MEEMLSLPLLEYSNHPIWSLSALQAACARLQIQMEDAHYLSSLSGMSAVAGGTILISVRANLPEREKLVVLARELAHLALGHVPSALPTSRVVRRGQVLPRGGQRSLSHPRLAIGAGSPKAAHDDIAAAHDEAEAWAAQLLITRQALPAAAHPPLAHPHPWDSRSSASGELDARFVREMARRLHLPSKVVARWLGYEGWAFEPGPNAWLHSPPAPVSDQREATPSDLWAATFAQTYRVVKCVRDHWLSCAARAEGDVAPCQEWCDVLHGERYSVVVCQPSALPQGEPPAVGTFWDVVLWYRRRRWWSRVRSDCDTSCVVAAQFDPHRWADDEPPWRPSSYEAWVVADLTRSLPAEPPSASAECDIDVPPQVQGPLQFDCDPSSSDPPLGQDTAQSQATPDVPPPDSHPAAVARATRPTSEWQWRSHPREVEHGQGAPAATASPAMGPTSLTMSLRWADLPKWHADPGYSAEVAEALIGAYILIKVGRGDVRAYLDAYACVSPIVRQSMSLHQRLHLTYLVALMHSAIGDYSHAVECIDTSLELAEELSDSGACVDLLYLRGSANRAVSRLREAADDYQTCIQLVNALGEQTIVDTSLLLDLVTQLAGFEFFLGRYDIVEQRLDEARILVPLSPTSTTAAATIEWVQALVHRLRGQPERALRRATAAAEVYIEHGISISAARIQTLVADIALDLAILLTRRQHNREAMVALAMPYCELALRLTDDVHDEIGRGLALLTSVRCSRISGSNMDRIASIERVQRTAQRLGDTALLAQALTGLGEEFAARGEMESARACYRSVLSVLDGTDMPSLGLPARRALLLQQEMATE